MDENLGFFGFVERRAEPYNTGTSVLTHHSSCSHEPVFEPDLMIVGSRSTPSEAEPER